MPGPLEFFFDVGSPYSHLAAQRLARRTPELDFPVNWRPMLLGAVFKATGNDMPARVPARGQYLLKDLERWAIREKIPFSFPRLFPLNTLVPMRAIAGSTAEQLPELALSLFEAYWVHGQDISDPILLQELLGPEAVKRTQEPWVKKALRANTEEAVARGAFGAPSFFVGKALFFGNDRLEFALEAAAT